MSVRKVTQKELSENINLSATSLSAILRRGDMKVSLLENISKFLEVSPAIFFDKNELPEGVQEPLINYQRAEGVGNHINFNADWKEIARQKLKNAELKEKLKACEEREKLKNELLKEKNEVINLLKEKR